MSAGPSKSSYDAQSGLPKVGNDRLVALGQALREEYAEIEREPLPDRLKAMIEALKEAEQQARGKL